SRPTKGVPMTSASGSARHQAAVPGGGTAGAGLPALSYDELLARPGYPPGSTWGLFGPDDEIGMINVLTAERVLDGMRAVRRGTVFHLDLPLDAFVPALSTNRLAPKHTMVQYIAHHWDDYVDGLW